MTCRGADVDVTACSASSMYLSETCSLCRICALRLLRRIPCYIHPTRCTPLICCVIHVHASMCTVKRRAGESGQIELPRAALLLLGGDLAYPNPTEETYETR